MEGLIGVLILTAWSVIVAWNEAAMDARTIKNNEPIHHAKELQERIRLVLPVTALIAFAMCWIRWDFTAVVPLVAVSWASFTIPFRLVLNLKRELDWRYISPGNWYDSLYLSRVSGVLRAGFVAYLVETTVFALAIAVLMLTNTN